MGQGFAGFGPEKAAGDAAVFFDGEGEGEKLFDVLLDVFGGVLVQLFFVESLGQPGGVETEIDADVSVLLEAGVVEVGTEAEDADGGGLELPEGVEVDEGVVIIVLIDVGIGSSGGWSVVGFGDPELPAHLELVGHVVVELLGGLGHGGLDDGVEIGRASCRERVC